ncbi:MAG: preprotein translocase subunit SecA [Candidatus Magasanikbacteria bacterium RIFCSPHIGHO2_02_FULL_47_14]|uniref:Protein translocase subunit SecA n=1 Tax=Candidatus Magasanikbacteria bacterium RIFCSPHIGHO2_02_FULL_47_14 TaxID=1798680 RepID=A0A1F6M443_9BACT|nr:MAG: preprotein translocase subunit SecA [Candidatus Magasanikbacteria bacterium RIFCSPHIGHO2_02_FULL_47_14]
MSIIKKAYEKIFGSHVEHLLKEARPIVDTINALETEFEKLSDDQLKAKTPEFKARLADGETLDQLLPEAFAAVREASKRSTGMRHFDVQLIGGIALHRGNIAEMRTGEGKTLVATLPAYLNALEGKGVHVVTVNDYLAKRDAVWMGKIYDFLGLTVGVVQNLRVSFQYDSTVQAPKPSEQEAVLEIEKESFQVEYEYLRDCTRQEAYRCDITYGTNNEFGFDYLRDNMVQDLSDMVMRTGSEMHYGIVDEIDSILIDEARTPLIISAPAGEATEQYFTFAQYVKRLKENEDYNVDEKLRSATLTEEGIHKFEQWLGVENIYAEGGMRTVHHIEQALKAEMLFKRDRDYVVDGDQVIIIDEFTGRKMPGRRYSEGLHQAIEGKENVPVQQESRTLATITFQNLFRMYKKLSGMTGTAATEEEEFRSIYSLDVITIPTNKQDQRFDHSDRIYKTEEGKYKAIVEKVKECQTKQQPILIGTISVQKNEGLSLYLTEHGITHEVLNAKNHEREGEIIAQAGRPGAVTLATNMAGRGVDIKLGGVPATAEDRDTVIKAGGLFVLGTERHESRRIDNQLRGRSARQGDPGETQFFVSTEDDLMRIFAGDRLKSVMSRLNVPDDVPIETKMITRMLETAQKKVESYHFDIRKHLLEYDDILNKQRHVIYKKRREILENTEENKNRILEMVEQEIEFVVSFHTIAPEQQPEAVSGDWNINEIYETARTIFPLNEKEKQELLAMAGGGPDKLDNVKAREDLVNYLFEKAKLQYEAIEQQVRGTQPNEEDARKLMTEIQKQVLIRAIDTLWVDHLVEMDYLRTGIGLRGYGQRDPLVEYKKESFDMFARLQQNIQKEIVYSFFKVGVGLQLAPSIMAGDSLVLKGAEKTSDNTAQKHTDTGLKKKMSKKERRRLRREGGGLTEGE